MLTIIITQLLYNKKMLKKVDAKTKRKTQCLLFNIKKLNVIKSSNYLATNALIEASSIIWFSFVMLDNLSNVNEISK